MKITDRLTIKLQKPTKPYHASKISSSWIDSTRKCTLGTPPIEYTTKHVDIAPEYVTEDLWVGYHLAKTTFEFQGCYDIEKLKTSHSYDGNDLGRCYSACEYTLYTGISKAGCFCTETKPTSDIFLPNCDQQCDGRNIPCGRYSYMALYKVTLNRENTGFERDGDEGDGLLNISAKKCVGDNGKLTSSGNLSLRNGTGLCWTVITRRTVIVKYNESLFDPSTLSKASQPTLGYIYKADDGQIMLGFSINSQKKIALCTGDSITSTDRSTDENQGAYIGVSVAAAILFIVLAGVLIILKRRKKLPHLCSKTMLTTEESQLAQTAIELSNDTVHCSHINPSYDVSDQEYTYDIGNRDNTGDSDPYSLIQEHIGDPDQQSVQQKKPHNYFILEKYGKCIELDQDVAKAQENSNDPHNYVVLKKHKRDKNQADIVCGTKRPGNNSKEIDGGNIYNTIKDAGNPIHDHVYNTTKKELQSCNETYDNAEKAHNKLNASAERCPDETDVDTYNHTAMKALNRSDNIYGTQLQLNDSNRDINEQFSRTDQLDLDTYSHLNRKPTDNNKPDNLYGIHNEKNGKCNTWKNPEGDYDITHNISVITIADNTYSKI